MNTQTAVRQSLSSGTITVLKIFPAKGPGRSATIKDVDGMMFGFYPDKIGIFHEGGTFDIEFAEKVKDGTTYRDIIAGTAAAPPPRHEPEVRQPARQATQASTHPNAPQASNGNGGKPDYYRPTAPRDSERMFVCSTLNAFIQTGRVDPHKDHLIQIIGELRTAYAATFGQDDPH